VAMFNAELSRWRDAGRPGDLDAFLVDDGLRIAWSRDLKGELKHERPLAFDATKIRTAEYRPFSERHVYFDRVLNEEVYGLGSIFPTVVGSPGDFLICVTGPGSDKPFVALAANRIVDFHLVGGGCTSQCFPFFVYDQDGSNRRENITDWALAEFQRHYRDDTIAKWDIFHYVYAVLHHQEYRERYAANLKRELPRIPYAPDFWGFAKAGARLADLHVNYEQQPDSPLQRIENPKEMIDFRVEKMRLGKDKTAIVYNRFLTLSGIPPEVFEYRLGNRSALEWIIDQYQVSTDKRSGITNDPNRPDDPEYIVRLIGQVITVSLETVKIVNGLPELGLAPAIAASMTEA
ncbi:MAG: type ISP restriction/modification enzyme, partial [Terriglobales bacterium]